MEIKELILKSRSYRRFYEDHKVDINILYDLIDLARFSPSAANMQPLKYILSCDKEKNDLIFPNLAWAGYLKDWDGPEDGEKPTAYVIILGDNEISKNIIWDHGIVSQSMLLGAVEQGLGGYIIGSIKKDGLRESLNIPERYEILLVLALGKPKEIVQLEDVGNDGDITYWRDDDSVHHVPKRLRKDLIIE